MIGEKMTTSGDKRALRSAMEKVLRSTKSPKIRERAQKVLNAP
jgi:hypothetical protein